MNYYIVVEDTYSPEVYKEWIRYINQDLIECSLPTDIKKNNFYFSRGYGYPHYFETITADLQTAIALGNIDSFIILVDSEDMSYADKYQEIENHIHTYRNSIDIKIVIESFCFEAWALGNCKLIRQHPQDERLRGYLRHYNVSRNDPEYLPPYRDLNRSQLAEVYLRAACLERFKTYQKRNPTVLTHPTYFKSLVKRLEDTGHIQSFRYFIEAFKQ